MQDKSFVIVASATSLLNYKAAFEWVESPLVKEKLSSHVCFERGETTISPSRIGSGSESVTYSTLGMFEGVKDC